MLQITVPSSEFYDEAKDEFIYTKEQTLQLEHSLVSLSKWEAKWKKAFLGKQEKTYEETIDYIRCMTITKNVDPAVYDRLSQENINEINEYIGDSMTATYIREDDGSKASKDTVTAELIYYWMIAQNIPFECQKWHLNRLLMLIKVCSVKNAPPKKINRREAAASNAKLNAARRKRLHTKG